MTRIDIGEHARLYERDEWNARPWRDFNWQADQQLTHVVLHHTVHERAEALDHFAEQVAAMQSMQNFHMDSPLRRYSDIGYSFVVFQEYGNLEVVRIFRGRPVNHVTAAQTPNTGKIAISICGDFQGDDSFKPKTVTAVVDLIKYVQRHNDDRISRIGGHRDINETTCPGSAVMAKIPEIARRTNLRAL